jgi:hypothetical protein
MGVLHAESNERLKRNVHAINSGAAHPIHDKKMNTDEAGTALYNRFYGKKMP